ncbi:MAG: serine/threonine protein kinase [Vitreoscilla sp.]|nr:serine/threonine protein kinase [Vitreoscilla sp.]
MALDPAELARLSELLDELLDLPAGQRAAWLAALGPVDEGLRPQLTRMLAELETGDAAPGLVGLLDQMPQIAEAAAEERLASAAPAAGTAMKKVGPYCLLRPLGRGGMGTVWLAERVDGAFSRTVALKLPHVNLLEPALAHRFERERDILAALEHPHIARLYDAGVTEDGQPYLALEHVEGVPITTHCDRAGLGLRQRIGLFIQVLQAVQYAHARLVVHRDLKPSNIFVTPEGQVRLLDFGIATLLDDGEQPRDQAPTEWSHAPMTPDYASPEQIARQPIGTASDVYSLGVVFYELITGQRPYRLARDSRGALEDAILGTDPTKPSRMPTTEGAAAVRGAHLSGLRRQLRGDLDNISLKALRKESVDRYASAEAFEQDLIRWLRNEPVLAHPGHAAYRAAKFIRRNRWQVGAVAGVGLALIGGTGIALHQATLAQREAARAQAVQQFLVGLFNEADPARAQGRELTVRDLMARGERDLEAKLSGTPELNATLTGVLVRLYLKLGEGKRALPLAQRWVDLALGNHGPDSLELAEARLSLGFVQTTIGQHQASLATMELARPTIERQAGRQPEMWLRLRSGIADNLLDMTRYAEGRELLESMLPDVVAFYGAGSYEVVSVRTRIAVSLATEGRHQEAVAALRTLEPLLENTWPEEGLGAAIILGDVGYTEWQLRRWPEAAHSLRRAAAELDRLAGPNNTQSIQVSRTLGMVHIDAGQFAQASEVFSKNLERAIGFYGPQDSETALNMSFLVMALARTGDLVNAEAKARESVRLAKAHTKAALSASEIRGLVRRLGAVLVLAGKGADALAVLDPLLAEEAAAGQRDTRHAATLMYRAGALSLQGRHRDAVAAAAESAEVWRKAGAAMGPSGQIGLAKARLTEALAWLASNEPAPAEALLAEAASLLKAAHASPHPDHAVADLVKAQWLHASGQPGTAETLAREARERFQKLSGSPAPGRLVVPF